MKNVSYIDKPNRPLHIYALCYLAYMVGGPDGIMLSNIIYAQFSKVNNWPMGAALAISMLITVAAIALVGMWLTRKATERIT